VTGRSFARVSTHGPGIYLVQYLATCKHRMQAMPSPASGMLRGALVAIVPLLRQDCYCLSALYGFGWRYLTGLVWMCYTASFSRFPRTYRVPQDRIQCEERAGLGRNYVGCMRPIVLARLDSMRLAVVAQHLHIADTDRIPAVRCDGSAENREAYFT
jgi:hypothetical protein